MLFNVVTKERLKPGIGQRLGEIEALDVIHPEALEEVVLFARFHDFADDLHLEGAGDIDDGFDDRFHARGEIELLHEDRVNLKDAGAQRQGETLCLVSSNRRNNGFSFGTQCVCRTLDPN